MSNVKQDKAHQQFVEEIDSKLAILKYDLNEDGKTIDFYSTFVPPELRGQGVAERLAKAALEYAAVNNLKVVASCSFVQRFIQRHSEYQGLLRN